MEEGSATKKKRKKKKKKKATAAGASISTTNGEGEDPAHDKEIVDGEEEDVPPATVVSNSEENHAVEMREQEGLVPEESTSTSDLPLDNHTLQREERLRRCRMILDYFLDDRIRLMQQKSMDDNTATTNNHNHGKTIESSTTGADSFPSRQRLQSFVSSTLNDDEFRPLTSTKPEPLHRGKNPVTKSLSYSSLPTPPATFISVKQIEAATETIQCVECRKSVKKLLLQRGQPRQPKVQIPLEGVFVSTKYDVYDKNNSSKNGGYDNDEDNDDDDPEERLLNHQYHLMEEGVFTSTDAQYKDQRWNFDLVTKNVSDSNEANILGWQLRRPLTSRQKSSLEKEATVQNDCCWSIDNLEFLVNQYVLLLGLPPSTVTKYIGVEDNVISSISKSVISKITNIFEDINQVTSNLARLLQQMKKTLAKHERNHVDWQSFPKIKDVDDACNTILDHLLDLVVKVTRSVQRGLSCIGGKNIATKRNPEGDFFSYCYEDAYSECHWSITQCTELWKRYLSGIHTVLCLLDTYETKLFSFADRQGNLPMLFVDVHAREIYRDYVEKKCFVVRDTVTKIVEQLDSPIHIGGWSSSANTSTLTHFLRRVFTEEAFFQIVVKTHCRQPFLDVACEDVAQTVRELTETVHDGSIRKVIEEHQKRDNKMMRLLSVVSDNVDEIVSQSANASPEEIEVLEELQEEMISLQINECFASKEEEEAYGRAWRLQLVNGLKKAMKSFVLYRFYHNIDEIRICDIPQLPQNLRHAMLRKADPPFPPCSGGNEQNRASCILLALFFRQLSDRFKEWHSQVIADELLARMGDDTLDSGPAVATKAKKMKKKSKGRTGQNSSINADEIKINQGVTTSEVQQSTCVAGGQTAIAIPETEKREDKSKFSSEGNEGHNFENYSVEMDSMDVSLLCHGSRLEESTIEPVNNADENFGYVEKQISFPSENDMMSMNGFTTGSDCQADGPMKNGPASDANNTEGKDHIRHDRNMKIEHCELPALQNIYAAVMVEVLDDNESFSAEEFFVGRMEGILQKVPLAILLE